MSRLESFIRRLEAQRRCLDRATALIVDVAGPVIELGLGNGRTYDHLRELLPHRRIFAFDRQVLAHPACVPSEAFLILGDFEQTLLEAGGRIGEPVALCHADIGTGDEKESAALAQRIAPKIDRLMRMGGVVLGDQPMSVERWHQLPLPDGVARGRYFLYRVS